MVLNALHGLSPWFSHMSTLVAMHQPFRTFVRARSLLLEELKQKNEANDVAAVALLSTGPNAVASPSSVVIATTLVVTAATRRPSRMGTTRVVGVAGTPPTMAAPTHLPETVTPATAPSLLPLGHGSAPTRARARADLECLVAPVSCPWCARSSFQVVIPAGLHHLLHTVHLRFCSLYSNLVESSRILGGHEQPLGSEPR